MPMWNSGSRRSSMWPPRSSLRVLHCPPRGLALLGAALRGGRVAPTFVTACSFLPPKGAAAPAARQSRFRGPCWSRRSLRPTLFLFTALPNFFGTL